MFKKIALSFSAVILLAMTGSAYTCNVADGGKVPGTLIFAGFRTD